MILHGETTQINEELFLKIKIKIDFCVMRNFSIIFLRNKRIVYSPVFSYSLHDRSKTHKKTNSENMKKEKSLVKRKLSEHN